MGKASTFGLTWTPYGGGILPIEAITRPGTGMFTVHAGSQGAGAYLLRQSQQVISWVVRHGTDYGITPELLRATDIELALYPESLPVDGASSGGAMLCAIMSALLDHEIDPKTAIIGAVDPINSLLLPAGGIIDKLSAAQEFGLQRIIVTLPPIDPIEVANAMIRTRMQVALAISIGDMLAMVWDVVPDASVSNIRSS